MHAIDLQFGMEMECHFATDAAARLCKQHGFKQKADGSILTPEGKTAREGSEVVTGIIPARIIFNEENFTFVIEDEEEIERKVAALCACAGGTNKSCGVHIHFGVKGRNWTDREVENWLLLGLMCEDRIMKAVPNSRRENIAYCDKIIGKFSAIDLSKVHPKRMLGTLETVRRENTKRYCWLNFLEVYRPGGFQTIENRLLGNTKRFSYIYAWLRLWLKIAAITTLPEWKSSYSIRVAYGDGIEAEYSAVLKAKNLAQRY